MEEKSVCIIIINWKNFKDTCECLVSLSRIVYSNLCIVIVNNDEEDFPETKSIYDNLVVINNKENLGFAAANNIGILHAISQKADYILILNNDTVVSPDFIGKLIAFCEQHPNSIVSPLILKYDTDHIENMGGKIRHFLGMCTLIKHKYQRRPDYLSGACFLARREYFEDIGLFDKAFFTYYEDVDWCFRAVHKNYELNIVPESIIRHKHSASTRDKKGWGYIKAYYIARNSIVFGKKQFTGLKRIIWIINYIIFGSNIHLILYARNFKTVKNHFLGIWDGLSNRPLRLS